MREKNTPKFDVAYNPDVYNVTETKDGDLIFTFKETPKPKKKKVK